MKRKIVPIALLSLLTGVAFDVLLYNHVPGVSVLLYVCLVLGGTYYLAQRFGAKLNPSVHWLTPVILFFAGMIFVRANEFLTTVNMLLVIVLLLTVVRLTRHPRLGLHEYRFAHYFYRLGWMPLQFLQETAEALRREVQAHTAKHQRDTYAPVVRGLLLSIPLLILFSVLLSSADLVFQDLLGGLVDFELPGEALFRGGLMLFVASLFVGAYSLMFIRPGIDADLPPTSTGKKLSFGATESSIVLGSVGLLFLVFVLIQVTYLFGGSDQIAPTGYTYAEYARKGFFELIAVAVISLVLIWQIKLRTALGHAKQLVTFKWLSGALIAEVMIIMLSAHQRLNLYEEAYGFTTLRLLSHLFIGWLAVAFVLLALYVVRDERENQFAFRALVSVLAFFALFNLINPDAFIARQNIKRFERTGKLDLYYLSNLSTDATPAIADLLDHQNPDLQKRAANILYRKELRTHRQAKDWQSANLARNRATQIFKDNATQLEDGKNYYDYDKFDFQ